MAASSRKSGINPTKLVFDSAVNAPSESSGAAPSESLWSQLKPRIILCASLGVLALIAWLSRR